MSDKQRFENEIRALEAQLGNIGTHLALDGAARVAYARQIKAMADELRAEATSGRITWAQAADKAQTTRNAIMELIRSRSTPVGRAMAQQLKREGKTLNELVARKVSQLYGARGPGARVCVTVGAFVGGALAAFGVSALW